MKLFKAEPYKLLFLVGLLFSVLGVGQWIFFYFGLITNYPVRVHSQLMILGFVFSFVSGFLMTAVPRMTATQAATSFEELLVNCILLFFLIFNLFGFYQIALLTSIALFIFLISFFIRRKLKMEERSLPTGFFFVPLGLLSGLLGSIFIFLSNVGLLNLLGIGKLLLYEGFVLNLIIGLGTRLVPILTRKSNALSPLEVNEVSQLALLVEAILFNLSFLIEGFLNAQFGVLIRCLVVGFVVYKNFFLFKPMIEKTKLGYGLLVATISIPICYFLILVLPLYRAHLIHILYVTGFALLSLLVSVRVSLSHGGSSLSHELTSNTLLVITGVLFLSMFIRVLTPFYGGASIFGLYALTSTVFIGGALVWAFFTQKVKK